MTSKIKVDNITDQGGNNMVVKCGTTQTLGTTGVTIALASGASQTGFGRTGTVDWQTGDIKTATFTAVSGQGFFCDTNGGSFEVDLPAGSAGAIVSIQDYRNTFDTHNLTVDPNGSEKINGGGAGDPVTLSTEGQGVTFVYIDSTIGWRSVQDNTYATQGSSFISATGGTVTCSGNCKIHTFTGPGTFCVSVTGSAENNVVSYMVVAGGAGGGGSEGGAWGGAGGGGAGGFREFKSPVTPYTASPLDGNPGGTQISVSATAFPITVGAGGSAGPGPNGPTLGSGGSGSNSIFSTVTSAGGGGGQGATPGKNTSGDRSGGSGGGGGYGPGSSTPTDRIGGIGNTPPVSPPQGNNGGLGLGAGSAYSLGGGGGATQAGVSPPGPNNGSNGGAGATTSISASPVAYAGGGGSGAAGGNTAGSGGTGGGANGGSGPANGNSASANTGGGGGGGAGNNTSPLSGGSGGSGIVIIRYKFQ